MQGKYNITFKLLISTTRYCATWGGEQHCDTEVDQKDYRGMDLPTRLCVAFG